MERLAAAAVGTLDEFYARCREAEAHRAAETHAALVLQACWRGCWQRQALHELRHAAVTIQCCWRGHLGRRRFAAALAAHNTQLRQAYFSRHATVIQACWRGHFSRRHVHDFCRRRAFLAAVAAANEAAKAQMAAGLQDALAYQAALAQTAARAQFDTQVSKLHHLSSTACIPGIFSPLPPANAAPADGHQRGGCTVAGQPLEHHLRTSSKQQARQAARRQQGLVQHALSGNSLHGSCIFPAGTPLQPRADSPLTPTAAAAAGHGSTGSSAASSAVRPAASVAAPAGKKLSHRLVEACVDGVFAARAAPNMRDGTFNPGLSLQQAADFEAARDASDLERRLERGLMLVLHHGQPFIPLGTPLKQAADGADGECIQPQPLAAVPQPGESIERAAAAGTWRPNAFAGGMFSPHLKQVY